MSGSERSLGLTMRFKAQMEQRWFEMTTDSVLMVAGLISCFVLTGALGPIAFYLTVCVQLFEVALASFVVQKEMSSLKGRANEYRMMLKSGTLSEKEGQEITAYLEHFERLIAYEKKRLTWSVISLGIILVTMTMALPILAFNPFIPLAGALLAVIMSGIQYTRVQHIKRQSPVRNASNLLSFGIFKGGSKAKCVETESLLTDSRLVDPGLPVSMVC